MSMIIVVNNPGYELIERDAVAIWWYNRMRRPSVDLDAVGDSYLDELRDFYERRERDLWVLDITTDIGIPAFAAISARRDGPTQDIVLGFGAHSDYRIGVMRAITEVNQLLPAVLKAQPDGSTKYGFKDKDAVRWWTTATVEAQPYLRPLSGSGVKQGHRSVSSGRTARDRLSDCIAAVEHMGMEVLVLDQTRPDVNLPVVKILVPGLRHFWARFAPGRLYDAPVNLGWTTEPTPEERLNPIAMFL